MKAVLSLFLLILTFNYVFNESNTHPGKEFYNEFLKVTKKLDADKVISDQCFGRLFEYYLLVIKMSFYQNDFMTFYTSLENILYDSIFLNCPIKSMTELFEDLHFDTSAPDVGTQIYKKLFKIVMILFDEFSAKEITPEILGRTTGKIFNLFRKDFSKEDNEKKNQPKKPFNLEDYYGLIEGLFSGMKKEDAGQESRCYKYIIKGKKEIEKFIEKGMKGIENGKPVKKMIKTVIFNLMTVEGMLLDCNLMALGGSVITKLSSKKELELLGDKFAKEVVDYIEYFKNAFFGYREGDLRKIGLNVGKFISSLLDFYVN